MADTLLLMTFSWASKRGNISCGRKMFRKEIRNIFVSRTQILCPQQMLPARANREIFVRHNVSETLCPRLPPPLYAGLLRMSSYASGGILRKTYFSVGILRVKEEKKTKKTTQVNSALEISWYAILGN